MSLYHTNKGIPEAILRKLPTQKFQVCYSYHAQEARLTDRYGEAPEMKVIDPQACKVIEVETIEGRIEKVVYRTSATNDLDICLAVLINKALVKTVWMNRKNDTHKTLDLSKYN